MYGTSPNCRYDWGLDPARGDPASYWQYHEPIYQECRRVLRAGGPLAWAVGCKFCEHFHTWFGGHRLWSLFRYQRRGKKPSAHLWLVQTREQKPIEFPHRNPLVIFGAMGPLIYERPCIKPPEELAFIDRVTGPAPCGENRSGRFFGPRKHPGGSTVVGVQIPRL